MAADHYCADTENGEHVEDPSEDALFELIDELALPANTFVTITPADDDPSWYASVSLLEDGTYEVEHRDASRREHELTIETDLGHIAKELTIWLAARDYPD